MTRAETKRILAEAEELKTLLAEFGANLSGFGNGVSANLPGVFPVLGTDGSGYFGEALNFSHTAWKWLKPLLVELKARREGKL